MTKNVDAIRRLFGAMNHSVGNLKTLITENTPTRLIAMKLGRTEDSVRDKVNAEGFSLAPTNRSPRD